MLYSMLEITVAEVSRYSRIMNKALGVEQHDAEGGVRCLRQVHYSPILGVGTPRMPLSQYHPVARIIFIFMSLSSLSNLQTAAYSLGGCIFPLSLIFTLLGRFSTRPLWLSANSICWISHWFFDEKLLSVKKRLVGLRSSLEVDCLFRQCFVYGKA